MRRASTLLRTIRALTAIVTVWCVGCSGFDPLLDAVLGSGGSVMTCGTDAGAMSGGVSLSAAAPSGQTTVSTVPADTGDCSRPDRDAGEHRSRTAPSAAPIHGLTGDVCP
jgi:hypothetical protein